MEFAIVVPVLFLLVIGMLEFAFVMRDYLAVSSSTRVGARIAATGANAGQGTCPGLPIICVPGNVPALAQDAADAIQQAGTAMPQDSNFSATICAVIPLAPPVTSTTWSAVKCADEA